MSSLPHVYVCTLVRRIIQIRNESCSQISGPSDVKGVPKNLFYIFVFVAYDIMLITTLMLNVIICQSFNCRALSFSRQVLQLESRTSVPFTIKSCPWFRNCGFKEKVTCKLLKCQNLEYPCSYSRKNADLQRSPGINVHLCQQSRGYLIGGWVDNEGKDRWIKLRTFVKAGFSVKWFGY